MEQEYWKRGKRELLIVYKDECGTQYIFFVVTGNKRFRLRFLLGYYPIRLKYVKTLGNYVMDGEWKLLGEDDDVLG